MYHIEKERDEGAIKRAWRTPVVGGRSRGRRRVRWTDVLEAELQRISATRVRRNRQKKTRRII